MAGEGVPLRRELPETEEPKLPVYFQNHLGEMASDGFLLTWNNKVVIVC